VYKTQFDVRRLLNCALSRMASAKGLLFQCVTCFLFDQ
jgi:hypothetical protein